MQHCVFFRTFAAMASEIHLPFSALTKKYLTKRYGEVWEINRNHLLGSFLIMGLRMLRPGERLYRGNGLYKVIFPQYLTDRLGKVYISPQNLAEFERLVRLQFREEMFREIDKAIIGGEQIRNAIAAFRDSFEIDEEDLRLETLFKEYQRHYYNGQRSDNKHFRQNIVKNVLKKQNMSKAA